MSRSTSIGIVCRTNLDDFKGEEWPEWLPAVPRRGQHVASKSGKRLCVVSTTWLYSGLLEVELHRPFLVREEGP